MKWSFNKDNKWTLSSSKGLHATILGHFKENGVCYFRANIHSDSGIATIDIDFSQLWSAVRTVNKELGIETTPD